MLLTNFTDGAIYKVDVQLDQQSSFPDRPATISVTLGDIMTLVDFLFITAPDNATLGNCL